MSEFEEEQVTPEETRVIIMSTDQYLEHLRGEFEKAGAQVVLLNMDYDALVTIEYNDKKGMMTRTMAFGIPTQLVDQGVDMITDITQQPQYQVMYADSISEELMNEMNTVMDHSPIMNPHGYADNQAAGVTDLPGIEMPDDL